MSKNAAALLLRPLPLRLSRTLVSYCCCAGCVCRVSLFFLSRIPTKDDVAPKYRLWRICAFKITAQDVLRRKYACRSRSLWPAAPAISTLSLMCSFCFLSASGCQVRILPLLSPPFNRSSTYYLPPTLLSLASCARSLVSFAANLALTEGTTPRASLCEPHK